MASLVQIIRACMVLMCGRGVSFSIRSHYMYALEQKFQAYCIDECALAYSIRLWLSAS